MKRFAAFLLSLCLFVSFAAAEEEGSAPEGIGSWFRQAWQDASAWTEQAWDEASAWTEQALDDASKWAEQAWKDAPEWLQTAWGDASGWVEQAWNEASPELQKIWGDVSTWASGVYDSVSGNASAWWAETFRKVTEAKDKAWKWIDSASENVRKKIAEKYLEAHSGIQNEVSEAGETMEQIYTDLLKKLNLNEEDIGRVLDTIKAYADQRGISAESVEQIMLPYLVQLAEDGSAAQNGQIPAIAVAQYLTGIMVEEGIGTEEDAQRMISTLKETLNIQ